MFYQIKLFFTDRKRYDARRRYIKRQKAARKELKKKSKEFCPWSGWYFHDMVLAMLRFYHATYEAGDCCWSEECRVKQRAKSLKQVLECADKLNAIDEAELSDLVSEAEAFSDFAAYCTKLAAKFDDEELSENMKGFAAYEFLEKKYTSMMYGLIGEHVWEWND